MYTLRTERGVGVCLSGVELTAWAPVLRGVYQKHHNGTYWIWGDWFRTLRSAKDHPVDFTESGGFYRVFGDAAGVVGAWMGSPENVPTRLVVTVDDAYPTWGEEREVRFWSGVDREGLDFVRQVMRKVRGPAEVFDGPEWVRAQWEQRCPGLWPPAPMDWGGLDRFLPVAKVRRWLATVG